MSGPAAFAGTPGYVAPEAIESVEVTKGPFSVEQGAFAMAGSAEYQLGIPYPDRGLRATYAIGTTNRHRGVVTYSPVEGDGHEFVALEAVHDDGFGQNRAIDRAVHPGTQSSFPIRRLTDAAMALLETRTESFRAYGRRIASGDVEALRHLLALADEIEHATDNAVEGLRKVGYSWGEIASRLHITRQAAHQRWGARITNRAGGCE